AWPLSSICRSVDSKTWMPGTKPGMTKLLLPALPLDLSSPRVDQCKAEQHAAIFDDFRHLRALFETIGLADEVETARLLLRIRLDENAQHDQRDREDGQPHLTFPPARA